jgi:hypothetical protein
VDETSGAHAEVAFRFGSQQGSAPAGEAAEIPTGLLTWGVSYHLPGNAGCLRATGFRPAPYAIASLFAIDVSRKWHMRCNGIGS